MRMPGAVWIGPTGNKTIGGMTEVRGLVLHVQQGSEAGTEAWFKESASKASSHFLAPKGAGLRQLVDTADKAWAEAGGNAHWVSLENEGYSGTPLTPSQVEDAAQLLAWLHTQYGVPLESTDDVNGRGLGWHGMGGDAWGGHPDCPGDPIKAQRPAIIARAEAILGGPHLVPFPGAAWFEIGRVSPIIGAMHERLVAEGCDHYQTHSNLDTIGSGDVASYEAWQRACGFSGADATWPPGKITWDKLRVPAQS